MRRWRYQKSIKTTEKGDGETGELRNLIRVFILSRKKSPPEEGKERENQTKMHQDTNSGEGEGKRKRHAFGIRTLRWAVFYDPGKERG